MSLYAFIILIAIISYIEITRRRNNKKVTTEIKRVKKEVKYQLDLFNKMFEREDVEIHAAQVHAPRVVLERNEKR